MVPVLFILKSYIYIYFFFFHFGGESLEYKNTSYSLEFVISTIPLPSGFL